MEIRSVLAKGQGMGWGRGLALEAGGTLGVIEVFSILMAVVIVET